MPSIPACVYRVVSSSLGFHALNRRAAYSPALPLLLRLPFAVILILPSLLRADLQWEKKEIAVEAKEGASFADVEFPFKNTGNETVYILSQKTSCKCVTTNEIKFEYAPGESGVLKARYNYANKTGATSETITLLTSDRDAQATHLRITIATPLAFRLSQQTALWNTGGAASPKTIFFHKLGAADMRPTVVYSLDENFDAVLQPASGELPPAIIITPKSTASDKASFVYMDVDLGNGSIRKIKILVAVRKPNSGPIKITK